jgi:proteic killer suppression protein
MEISYTPSFLRLFKSLPEALQDEAIEKIELFKEENNHKALKVHKLTGRLKGRYSFSVNYKTRIVFAYTSKKPKEATLMAIGDHDVYKK